MLLSVRHKGLSALLEDNDSSKLPAECVAKIRRILTALSAATIPQYLNMPGSGFHQLQGNLKGYYSVKVTANWRITFRFDGTHATDVDFQDYH